MLFNNKGGECNFSIKNLSSPPLQNFRTKLTQTKMNMDYDNNEMDSNMFITLQRDSWCVNQSSQKTIVFLLQNEAPWSTSINLKKGYYIILCNFIKMFYIYLIWSNRFKRIASVRSLDEELCYLNINRMSSYVFIYILFFIFYNFHILKIHKHQKR